MIQIITQQHHHYSSKCSAILEISQKERYERGRKEGERWKRSTHQRGNGLKSVKSLDLNFNLNLFVCNQAPPEQW